MAASGVTVQDKVCAEFNNLKIGHQYAYIQMKLTTDLKEIEIEKTAPSGSCSFEDFVKQLPPNDCRYVVYDFHFDTGSSGQRQLLIFILWCPETATVRQKMLYTSSKDALKKKLVGICHEIQATEVSELSIKDVMEKVSCKMVK